MPPRIETWTTRYLTACFLFMVCAASFSGWMGKWGLRDYSPRASLAAMVSGSADRPFVYRILVPSMANWIAEVTPPGAQAALTAKLGMANTFSVATQSQSPEFGFRHLVISYAVFAALLASAPLQLAWLSMLGVRRDAALLSTTAILLAFPYLATVGGFFYDAWEFCMLLLACIWSWRGRVAPLLLLTALATLNKESFLFFVPALFPLLKDSLGPRRALIWTVAMLVTSAMTYLLIRNHYALNPGGSTEFHLMENLQAYLNPKTYLGMERTYGIVGPAGASFVTLLAIAIVAARAWPQLPAVIRQHAQVAAAINLPLLLVFCAAGELRNLSLCLPTLVALAGLGVNRHRLAHAA